ncbi:hypothetical protein SUGI_0196940 [Cryptomeria japonica]|nr:hypothetical protein SUGI_0196940 [Cryptomeria japonica]
MRRDSRAQNDVASGDNRIKLGLRRPTATSSKSIVQTRCMEGYNPKQCSNNTQKPSCNSADNIVIISDKHTDELWDRYNDLGLFGKWFGFGASISNVLHWLKFATENQISITCLENDFLFIKCNSCELKYHLLRNNHRFFKGYCFKNFNWKPNFSPKDFDKLGVPKWIRLPKMSVELIHNHTLKKLGDFLGGFEGMEENYMDSSDIKILASVEIDKLKFEPIKIITNHSIYQIHPEILMGDTTAKEVISPIQNIERKSIKTKNDSGMDKGINIKLNPKGGFVLHKQNPRAKALVNNQKMVEYKKDKTEIESTPKEPVIEQRRNNIENKESYKQEAIPLINNDSKEQSEDIGKEYNSLMNGVNIDNQEETIGDIEDKEDKIEESGNHPTPHATEKERCSKKKKKNKNKKGKKN